MRRWTSAHKLQKRVGVGSVFNSSLTAVLVPVNIRGTVYDSGPSLAVGDKVAGVLVGDTVGLRVGHQPGTCRPPASTASSGGINAAARYSGAHREMQWRPPR